MLRAEKGDAKPETVETVTAGSLWVEKYRPTKLSDIVGHKTQVTEP